MPSTPEQLVSQILEGTNVPAVDFSVFLAHVYSGRFTGSITFHFHNGVPKKVEFPQPIILQLHPPA